MTVTFVPPFSVIADEVKRVAKAHGYKVYAVGGFVRDLLMGVESDDLDILIEREGDTNPAITFAEILVKEGFATDMAIYEKFGTSKVAMHTKKVEFVMPRGERYTEDSRKPEVFKVDIKGDDLRRDFTVNTLMVDLDAMEVIDPTGNGVNDLRYKILRSANPDVDKMFTDDPLRMLRAIRFSVCKGFTPSGEILTGIEKNVDRIEIISQERIRDEINKMLVCDKPSVAFRIMGATKLLHKVLPEMIDLTTCMETPPYHWNESSFEHTMRVLDNVAPRLLLRLTALLHDISKPETRTEDAKGAHFYEHNVKGAFKAEKIMRRLCYSVDEISVVHRLIMNHLRPHFYRPSFKDRSVRKFILDMQELLFDVMELAYADTKGSSPKEVEVHGLELVSGMKERVLEVMKKPFNMKPIVTGEEIMAVYGTKPGAYLRDVKNYVMELQMATPDITKEQVIENLKVYSIEEITKVMQERYNADSKPWVSKLQ